jgi:hypothetical protein
LGDNINTIRQNSEVVIDAGKEVDLKVNRENQVYVVLHQIAGKNHNVKITNGSLENVVKLN